MPELTSRRPEPSEFAPYYARYVAAVPEGDVLDSLEDQSRTTQELLAGVDDARARFRYAPGKWSVKEVVGHVLDVERVFAYRVLRFSRGDETELPGMEQDDYVAAARFDRRPLDDLAAEWLHVRRSNLLLFRSLDEEALSRSGVASECRFTVRALVFIIAGHERHHVKVLHELYLGS